MLHNKPDNTDQIKFFIPRTAFHLITDEVVSAINFIEQGGSEIIRYRTMEGFTKIYERLNNAGDLLRNTLLDLLQINYLEEDRKIFQRQLKIPLKPFSEYKDKVSDAAFKAYAVAAICYTAFLKNNSISQHDRLTFDPKIERVIFHANNLSMNYCKKSAMIEEYEELKKVIQYRLDTYKNVLPKIKDCANQIRATLTYQAAIKLLEDAYDRLKATIEKIEVNKVKQLPATDAVKETIQSFCENNFNSILLMGEFSKRYITHVHVATLDSSDTVLFWQVTIEYINKMIALLARIESKIEDNSILEAKSLLGSLLISIVNECGMHNNFDKQCTLKDRIKMIKIAFDALRQVLSKSDFFCIKDNVALLRDHDIHIPVLANKFKKLQNEQDEIEKKDKADAALALDKETALNNKMAEYDKKFHELLKQFNEPLKKKKKHLHDNKQRIYQPHSDSDDEVADEDDESNETDYGLELERKSKPFVAYSLQEHLAELQQARDINNVVLEATKLDHLLDYWHLQARKLLNQSMRHVVLDQWLSLKKPERKKFVAELMGCVSTHQEGIEMLENAMSYSKELKELLSRQFNDTTLREFQAVYAFSNAQLTQLIVLHRNKYKNLQAILLEIKQIVKDDIIFKNGNEAWFTNAKDVSDEAKLLNAVVSNCNKLQTFIPTYSESTTSVRAISALQEQQERRRPIDLSLSHKICTSTSYKAFVYTQTKACLFANHLQKRKASDVMGPDKQLKRSFSYEDIRQSSCFFDSMRFYKSGDVSKKQIDLEPVYQTKIVNS